MMAAMYARTTNNLTKLKECIDTNRSTLDPYVSDILYSYDLKLQVYSQDGKTRVSPTNIFSKLGGQYSSGMGDMEGMGMMSSGTGSVMSQMIGNDTLLSEQYDVIAGRMPGAWDEIVLIVDKNNQISKITLYMLGVLDQDQLEADMKQLYETGKYESADIPPYDYDYFLNLTFNMLLSSDFYTKTSNDYKFEGKNYKVWRDIRENNDFDQLAFTKENGIPLKVVGILRPDKDAVATSIVTPLGYTKALTDKVLELTAKSEIINQQRQTPDINVLTGMYFDTVDVITKENFEEIVDKLPSDKLDLLLIAAGQQAGRKITKAEFVDMVKRLDEESFNANATMILRILKEEQTTYEKVLSMLGAAEEMTPSAINFYAKDFKSKDEIKKFIEDYNKNADEKDKVKYDDFIGTLMSGITTIINVISYVLIAFVSISLVVSSIMIGIITYISVLERTKEIGILRAMGASKKDISRVFNAETLIVGFAAGVFGILITLILTLPINAIIHALSGIGSVGAKLPVPGAAALIGISMFLTWIAGLIPAKIASKKDPVEALRSE